MMLCLIFKISIVCAFLPCSESKSINSSTEEQLSFATLKQEVDILKDRINYLTKTYEKDKLNENKAVLFFVRLSTSITLNSNSIVKFDDAVINEGNHFNTGDGVFVAPVSGIYQFTWTTITYTSKVIETELRIDNVVKERSYISAGSGGYIPATKVALCSVRKGDHVWIQTTGNNADNYFARPNFVASSFTGMLIHY